MAEEGSGGKEGSGGSGGKGGKGGGDDLLKKQAKEDKKTTDKWEKDKEKKPR